MIEILMDHEIAHKERESHDHDLEEDQDHAPKARAARPRMPDELANHLVRLFKLLSDETRLRILLILSRKDELHVRALCDVLKQSQPAVSHHLALLRVAGLIDRRREGKHNYYFLVSDRFEDLLKRVFDASGDGVRHLRFKDYLLSQAAVE